MTTILLLLAVLFVLAVGTLVFQALHAPEGHENESGFHYTSAPVARRVVRETYTDSAQHESAAHVSTRHLPAV